MSQNRDLWVNTPVDTHSNAGDNLGGNPSPDDLMMFLCGSLAVLWKDWPKQMQCALLDESGSKFSLSGICPHCGRDSVFMIVAGPYSEYVGVPGYEYRHCAAMRCQGCLRFILGIIASERGSFHYVEHYPLGKPDDSVAEEVVAANPIIALDFAEALRCVWVKSYKAAVAMCRRSVEATCKHFGATGYTLEKKIDNLAAQGKITESLKEMAHAVRLSGNRGLHGKKEPTEKDTGSAEKPIDERSPLDDLDLFGEDEAKAMIAFTKELFHHVFVMPALLEKYRPKPKGEASEGS